MQQSRVGRAMAEVATYFLLAVTGASLVSKSVVSCSGGRDTATASVNVSLSKHRCS